MLRFYGWAGATPVRAALVAVLTVALVAAVLPAAEAAAADRDSEHRILSLIQRDRDAHARSAYRLCADLERVARDWSVRMANDGSLSHNPDRRAQVQGWRSMGENVGRASTADRVHQLFMESGDHRGNVLSSKFEEVGVGVERRDGRVYVTEVFREPDGSTTCERPSAAGGPSERIAHACPPDRVPATYFRDTADSHHRPAIDCVAWYSIASGASTSQFGVSGTVSRAQMASFVAQLIEAGGGTLPQPRDQGFADIGGNGHADRINQLAELGIVEGRSATRFDPGGAVSRGQIATFVTRAYAYVAGEQLPPGSRQFTDTVGNSHEDAINRAARAEFVSGTTSTTYRPTHFVRRAQMATMLARTLNGLSQDVGVAEPQ